MTQQHHQARLRWAEQPAYLVKGGVVVVANLEGYMSIPMCTGRQIGWLIYIKVGFDHKLLHRYIYTTIMASNKRLSLLELS